MFNLILKYVKWLGISLILVTGVTQAQINPWPWGKELPFPWSNIQGLWETVTEDRPLVYSFEVLNPADRGPRQIRIMQVDPLNLEVFASGVGIESKRVVRALMVGRDGISYRVSVRLVKEKKAQPESPSFTVLTMEAVNQGPELQPYHLKLQKISDIPVKINDNSKRKPISHSTSVE